LTSNAQVISKPRITAKKPLGLRELIAMSVGGMIGGGIFSVMGLAAGITGHATPIAFALGGLLALIGGPERRRDQHGQRELVGKSLAA
jgi:hypothetical protein